MPGSCKSASTSLKRRTLSSAFFKNRIKILCRNRKQEARNMKNFHASCFVIPLLLFLRCVPFLEFFNASRAVHKFLITREKWVAAGTNLHTDILLGGAS